MAIPFSQLLLLIIGICSSLFIVNCHGFSIRDATVEDCQQGFKDNTLTSRQLVEFYLQEIQTLNTVLRAVIEVNPDALSIADNCDRERRSSPTPLGGLHGIPILLKDDIATQDKLNTTDGSYALLNSVVPRDAGVVTRLRNAGAVILGKASCSEWSGFRGTGVSAGWCGRTGQARNPYALWRSPCGSSSGSAISVAANLATVSLGQETDGSMLCPASSNSVVAIKPTVGLTSRAGIVPVSPTQDTVGPMCRTVSDAVHTLDAIAGCDPNDGVTCTPAAAIPIGGYKQHLKRNGLQGKRLGIVRSPFFNFPPGSYLSTLFEGHIQTLRQAGAIVIDNLGINNIQTVLSPYQSGQQRVLYSEFKQSINVYLSGLVYSPVRSLTDIINFNNNNMYLEMPNVYSQDLLNLDSNGFVRLMNVFNLDAIVTPGSAFSTVLAIGGHPGISVPAGYDMDGMPIGMCFGGLKFTEAKLIECAYGFEQMTMMRRPPHLTNLSMK
ncbi:hypothetical protein C5167_027850 [Papaver somniferum]|nr:hypothetical protein C5167_027850 [Papaver somniferum]